MILEHALHQAGRGIDSESTWRMPLVGEYVDESWPKSYYRNTPRRFRVTEVGPTLRDVKVVTEPDH